MTREELNEEKQDEIFKEENREKRKKTFIKIIKITILVIILLYSFSLYTTNISTAKIIVKEERLKDSSIPDSFNGTKVIHFSDLHYGSNVDLAKVKEIVSLINERKPDLVFFTGDLIDKDYSLDNKEQEKLIGELKKIDASLGKYAVFGNDDGDNYPTIMNQSNFILLNNEYDLIYNKTNDAMLLTGFASSINDSINISKGLEYFNTETANSNIFSIAIFHEPDSTIDILGSHSVNLLLAGHSHNGDIRVPFIGSIKYVDGAKKYNNGFYNINSSKLYVSSGLGTQNNGIRLFCRPSINFFRLSNS